MVVHRREGRGAPRRALGRRDRRAPRELATAAAPVQERRAREVRRAGGVGERGRGHATLTRRSGATSACSGTSSAGCSSSRPARGCSKTSSGSGRSPGGPRPRLERAAGRCGRRAAARAPGRRAPRIRALLPACQPRRAAPPAPPAPAVRGGGAAPTRVARRGVRRCSNGAGVGRRRLATAARRLSLELVLTAHPTEATRRTVLAAHVRLSELLGELDDPALPPSTRDGIGDAIAEEVTALWQTDEVRSQRPRVVDEIRHGLWFFEQSLLDAAPALVGELRERLPDARRRSASAAGSAATRTGTPLPDLRRSRRRSAAPESSRSPATAAEVRELAAFLGSTSTLVGVSEELAARSPATSASSPPTPPGSARRTTDEPYRRKLSFVWHRLGETLARQPSGYARRTRSWPTSS